jgi:hypothetical protein
MVFSSFKLLDLEDSGNTKTLFGEFSWANIFSQELKPHALFTGTSLKLNVEVSKFKPLETKVFTTLTLLKCGTITLSKIKRKLRKSTDNSPTAFMSFSSLGAP